MKNTLKNGSVRVLIFRDRKDWVGAVLEFNIVETGDDPQALMLSLEEAIRGYVECVRKERLDESVLNQAPDPLFEKMWNDFTANKYKRPTPSIYSANILSLNALAN